MPFQSSKLVSHFVGVLAFAMVGVATGLLYVLIVGKLLGRGGDGFGLTASVILFPLLACSSAVLCWLPLWFLHNHRFGVMTPLRALLLGASIGAAMAIVMAGPSGFVFSGGAPMFGYFLILMLALGAAVHNWAATRGRFFP